MKRRAACLVLAALPAAIALPAAAQSASVFRVAWVSTDRKDSPSPNFAAFRGGMRDLGYVERRDAVIDACWGDGSREQVERMAGDIVRSKPDVIVAAGGLVLFALLRAGVKTPTVFSISGDPVEAKIIESLARPGGQLTGISLFTLALVGKRMELLNELLPGLKRVAVIANPQHPGEQKELDASQAAATKLGLTLHYFPVRSGGDLETALTAIAAAHDQAIVAFADGSTMGFAERIAAFSIRNRIPAVDGWAEFARRGNLMIYGPVAADVYRRLAAYVDRIRKGPKPADLPVELPTKVELVVNAKAAKAMRITIPPSILARADEVIR